MSSKYNNRKKKNIVSVIMVLIVICIVVVCIIVGIGIWLMTQNSSRYVAVGREVDVISIKDGVNCYGMDMVESNGDRTFIALDDGIYEYISDSELVEIKKIDTYVKSMGVTDRYLIFSIFKGGNYRIDISSWEEKELLPGKTVDEIVIMDDDYALLQYGEYVDEGFVTKESLYLFRGDSIEGEEIVLNEHFHISDEIIAGSDEVLRYENGEYTIFADKYEYRAIKKGDEIYPTTATAFHIIDEDIVSFCRDEYISHGETHKIVLDERGEFGVFTGMSCVDDDSVYALLQPGTGYQGGSPNPSRVYCDMLMKISPDAETEVLYKTDDSNRIVGYDADKNLIVLYNDKGQVCSRDLISGDIKVLTTLKQNSSPLLFECSDHRLYIFENKTNTQFLGSCTIE